MEALWNGLVFGLLLAVLIGPVFFALIQKSIEEGFVSGIWMAIGISLSDSIYITVTYLGISQLTNNEDFKVYLGFAGGALMMIFGISSILKPVPVKSTIALTQDKDIFKLIMKGFFLNGINPFVLLFWIGVSSMVSVTYSQSRYDAITFFIGIITTVLLTDITKSYAANKLRTLITPRFIRIINRGVGFALIVFGLRLFFYALHPEKFDL